MYFNVSHWIFELLVKYERTTETVDALLEKFILNYIQDVPCRVLLITGDGDFTRLIIILRSWNIKVFLAKPLHCNQDLVHALLRKERLSQYMKHRERLTKGWKEMRNGGSAKLGHWYVYRLTEILQSRSPNRLRKCWPGCWFPWDCQHSNLSCCCYCSFYDVVCCVMDPPRLKTHRFELFLLLFFLWCCVMDPLTGICSWW